MVTEITSNTYIIIGSFLSVFIVAFFMVWAVEAGINVFRDS